MPPEAHPRAVVFDMDGVLVDSSPIHAEAFRRTLATRGLPFAGYDGIAGLRTDAAFRRLMKDLADDAALVQTCVDEKRAHFRSLTGDMAPMMPNCVETVQALAARSIALGLATSGSRASMRAFLSASGLERHFSVTLCGDDVRAAKPAPDLYLRAFAGLGIDASQGLVVEDSEAGFLAATSAGAPCILFRPSADTRARHGHDSRAIIDDLKHLLDVFREDHP